MVLACHANTGALLSAAVAPAGDWDMVVGEVFASVIDAGSGVDVVGGVDAEVTTAESHASSAAAAVLTSCSGSVLSESGGV